MSGNDYYRRLAVGESLAQDGTAPYGRASRTTEQVVSQVHGRYYEQSKRGNIFYSRATIAAPVAFGTEAVTGGPYLYNPSDTHDAVLLGIYVCTIVSATQAGAMGLVFGYGETLPTTTVAIDSEGSLRVNSQATRMTNFRTATTLGVNRGFMPLMEVGTAAITVETAKAVYIPIDGMVTVPQRSFVAIAGNVVLTAWTAEITFVYEEVPV